MAEWSIALALKACEPEGSVGSNPTLSSISELRARLRVYTVISDSDSRSTRPPNFMNDTLQKSIRDLNEWQGRSDESIHNVMLGPACCLGVRNQPDVKYTFIPVKHFIGKYVKITFSEQDGPRKEHMWVKVTHCEGDVLHGVLNNDPIFCKHLKNDDPVSLTRDQVIEMIDG